MNDYFLICKTVNSFILSAILVFEWFSVFSSVSPLFYNFKPSIYVFNKKTESYSVTSDNEQTHDKWHDDNTCNKKPLKTLSPDCRNLTCKSCT